MSEQEELTVEGPGGLKAGYKGGQMLQLLSTILLGAWVWYQFSLHNAQAADNAKSIVVATDKQTAAIEKMTQAMERQAATNEKGQRTMAYILSLPQAKREKLGLAEPPEIRELRRRGED